METKMENNTIILPPILEGMVQKLKDERSADIVRINYRNSLDAIRSILEKEVGEFDKEISNRKKK